MTVDTLIMLAGASVAVLPFLGFPNSWDSVFFLIAGAFVISLGIVVRRRGKNIPSSRMMQDPHFVEHVPRAQVGVHEEV